MGANMFKIKRWTVAAVRIQADFQITTSVTVMSEGMQKKVLSRASSALPVRCVYHINYLYLLINMFQALVKVENEEYETRARPRVTNKDLPPMLAAGDTWTKKVVPTLFRWLAAQDDPWAPAAKGLEEAIHVISRHYADEEYDLEGSTSPEFQLVCSPFYIRPHC